MSDTIAPNDFGWYFGKIKTYFLSAAPNKFISPPAQAAENQLKLAICAFCYSSVRSIIHNYKLVHDYFFIVLYKLNKINSAWEVVTFQND